MLPELLKPAIGVALREAGDASPVRIVKPVRGGYANPAARIETDRRSYFLKWCEPSRPGAFLAEARGLLLLAQVAGARVPVVLAATDAGGEQPGFLLQEWIDARPPEAYWQLGARYGEYIARIHRTTSTCPVPGYGLDHDNYVGKSRQLNRWQTDWTCFFREQRLRPQAELAARFGLLPSASLHRLEWLLERLEDWLGTVDRQPVLLHGDLWSGNVLFSQQAEPVLIDPAVCWGDREFDLAAVQIYQPAPSGFYEAYQSIWPIEPGFSERCDLHNLYLCLCCLTEDQDSSFIPRIEAVLRRYVG